ncbi:SV2A [Cordylochernes scorpioides]|uniref:SV2A n=1 Tax=Cordylochernes scorpioides TaxID=51811 RepID=A0ABY6LJJ9_9ARAC|nr:SV2A [Cordylochernes scorpioides]
MSERFNKVSQLAKRSEASFLYSNSLLHRVLAKGQHSRREGRKPVRCASSMYHKCVADTCTMWCAGGISFLGMMVGGLVWGTLADRLGRRRTLISALATNAIFAIVTAFMPNYSLFLMSRFFSGIGVGGSLPIVFTYYSEFLPKSHRGRHLSWLLVFWAVGGVFTAVMAWGLIPRTGMGIVLSRNLHFNSWRIFLLLCSLPAILSCLGLIFFPESPRYLLEVLVALVHRYTSRYKVVPKVRKLYFASVYEILG